MSRSGYSEWYDSDGYPELYRHAVERAFNGKRGQSFLRDLLASLDAMPDKQLSAYEWVDSGKACALGVAALARGLESEFSELNPEDDYAAKKAARLLGIAESMAREIVFINDEGTWKTETKAERWTRVRAWVAQMIVEPAL